MPVVQRSARLYPLLQEPLSRYLPARRQGAAEYRRRDGLDIICAAGLMGAEAAAFAVAAGLVGGAHAIMGGSDAGWSWEAVATAVFAGLLGYFFCRSRHDYRVTAWTDACNVASAAAMGLLVAAATTFLLQRSLAPAGLLETAVIYAPLALLAGWLSRVVLAHTGVWQVSALVVGDGAGAAQAADMLGRHVRLGYDVVGQVGVSDLKANWSGLLRHHDADLLVLAPDAQEQLSSAFIADLVRERIPYVLLPPTDGLPVVGARQTYLDRGTIMVSYRNNARTPLARLGKLVFDMAAASAAVLVLAPAMLLIAAIVGLDGGPVFYAHSRVGLHGRVFRCLKFRSMVTDSDAALQRLFAHDPAAAEEWARTHKLRIDPRVTWIGRILRKTSLDELPQLFNVLRLEMSLVGPRPIVSLEIPKYAQDIAYYYETRPGITGLWQVSGRSDTTYAQRVRLDSWYVKNWSIWHDFSIIARTIPAVLSGRGAG